MDPSQNIDIAAGLMITVPGFFGMWLHWWVAKRQGHLNGKFIDYMLADSPTRTGVTFGVFLTAMAGLNWTGVFDSLSFSAVIEVLKQGELYKPAVSAVILSFSTGYMCDSAINKGGQDVSVK